MKEDKNMQDHINTFSKLVCQLLKCEWEIIKCEKALLSLSFLFKRNRNIAQT